MDKKTYLKQEYGVTLETITESHNDAPYNLHTSDEVAEEATILVPNFPVKTEETALDAESSECVCCYKIIPRQQSRRTTK